MVPAWAEILQLLNMVGTKVGFFFTAKKLFISGKSHVITSCCYCLAQGYGGLGTNGNAAGRYGE